MVDCLELVSNNLKQSFSSRGVTTQNIYVDTDALKSVAMINILWHSISFTTRCNYKPQALFRDDGRHVFSNRIMAIRGNYNEIIKDAKIEMKKLSSFWKTKLHHYMFQQILAENVYSKLNIRVKNLL